MDTNMMKQGFKKHNVEDKKTGHIESQLKKSKVSTPRGVGMYIFFIYF